MFNKKMGHYVWWKKIFDSWSRIFVLEFVNFLKFKFRHDFYQGYVECDGYIDIKNCYIIVVM